MRTGDKVAIALAIVVAIALISFISYLSATERELAESQARIQRSERVVFYEMLADQGDAGGAQKQDAAPAQATPELAASLRSARETIAAYAELFNKKSAWLKGTGYGSSLFSLDGRRLTGFPGLPAAPQELIQQIHETARLGGPVCALDFSDIQKLDTTHLDDISDCALLMEEYAKARLASGDLAEALRGFLTVMNLADALTDEPLIASQQYRREIYTSMEEYLDYKALTPDLAAAIVERLARADNRGAVHDALSAALQLELLRFEDWQKEPYSNMIAKVGLYWGTRSWLWARPMCRPWFNKDQQVSVEMITRMFEVPDLPYYQAKPILDQIEADIKALPYVNMASQGQTQWHFQAFSSQAQFELKLDVIQMRIAIEQYRAKHSKYPETLDAVADWFGGTLPVNPFTGHPYPYELDGDTYLLDDTTPDGAFRDHAEN